MSIPASNLDRQLAELKRRWEQTTDPALRAQLHQQANALRAAEASEAVANTLVYGRPEGAGLQYARSYMGANWTPAVAQPQPASPAPQLLRQVQQMKPAPVTPPAIQERPGQTVDLTPWLRAIGQAPAQPFNLQQLQQALARPLPEVPQARFASPEQLGQWIAQFQQVQEPWLQAATELARSEAARQLQNLQNQWAARGLLASGAAAAQEREAATELGRQLAEIRTRALADAVGQALQAGRLSLDEAAQLWQMAYQGRQAEVDNLLRALGLQEEMRQNWLDQLARYWQAQIGQSQWAQELGLQRAAQEFQRWAEAQRLDQAAREAWLDALLRAGGLAEEARQFERRMPLWEAELTGTLYGLPTLEARRLAEQARQFDIGTALDLSRLVGTVLPYTGDIMSAFQQAAGRPLWERVLREQELAADRWYRQQMLDIERKRLDLEEKRLAAQGNKEGQEALNLFGKLLSTDVGITDPTKRAQRREERLNLINAWEQLGWVDREAADAMRRAVDAALPPPQQQPSTLWSRLLSSESREDWENYWRTYYQLRFGR
ncbi:MAG: hypothetical protein AB1609_20115 [Bacillota bacterium]